MAEMIQKQASLQEMRQEQVMTHQQIQALEMLTAPVLELKATINAELEKNPVLELEGGGDDSAPLPTEDGDFESGDADNRDEWMEKVMKLDDARFTTHSSASSFSAEDQQRRDHYINSITTEESFEDGLLRQLSFLDLEQELDVCCKLVVDAINIDGYLTSHPADLAMISGKKMPLIEEAVTVIQALDPAGVATKDLRERLLLQLDRIGLRETLAYTVVSECLDDVARNRIPTIARKLSVSVDELQDALEQIQQLRPRLVQDNSLEAQVEFVKEEITITEKNGELEIIMDEGYLPSLRISDHYREVLGDGSSSEEVKDYIRDKIRAASFLINSLAQRQTTLRRIVEAIVEAQREFFLEGMDKMKPMTMAHIAEKVEVHETTISRGVSGKYMQCRHGLMPLRQFFSSGYEGEDGNSVSSMVVKKKIKEMIAEEDTSAPLSDSKIADELTQMGYTVARRTVAKYRESMKIMPSKQRRQYW